MHVTLVKKILASGEPCRKCKDVEERLIRGGYWDRIDEVLIADERDPDSAGMRLADQLGVTLAPFFVVREGDATRVYTLYFKFVKEVFEQAVSARSANRELLENNPDLDFI